MICFYLYHDRYVEVVLILFDLGGCLSLDRLPSKPVKTSEYEHCTSCMGLMKKRALPRHKATCPGHLFLDIKSIDRLLAAKTVPVRGTFFRVPGHRERDADHKLFKTVIWSQRSFCREVNLHYWLPIHWSISHFLLPLSLLLRSLTEKVKISLKWLSSAMSCNPRNFSEADPKFTILKFFLQSNTWDFEPP